MSDEIDIGDEIYISSKRASEITGYSRDYIGQLARKGEVEARRIGGLWYVLEKSLLAYKREAEAFKPEPPQNAKYREDPETIISFDGKEYVSAPKGAELTGYHQDYVAQLARGAKILSRQIGTRWYVNREALIAHKREKDALLAAVQAEAVGLRRSASMTSPVDLRDDRGPFMTYTSNGGDLMPVISTKDRLDYAYRQDEVPISVRISETHPIHIRKIDTNPQQRVHQRRSKLLGIGIPAIAATIVIVVMVGYVSIKSSAIYASNIVRETNFALVGQFATLVSRAGDFIENLVAPEITYSRSK